MEKITDISQLNSILEDNIFVLSYFSGKDCSVCHALKPKIDNLAADKSLNVYIVEINVEEQPELAAHYSVFTIPVVIFFVEGKEYIREIRNFSVSELQQKISKLISLYYQ